MNQFRVGDWVTLPVPFSALTGRVLGVHGSGENALITVEYPLDEGLSETLTKGFLSRQLSFASLEIS